MVAKEVVAEENKGFDLRVHITDPKTGRVVKYQPYRMLIDREKGTTFIRDGKRYSPDGTLLGPEEVSSKPGGKLSDKAIS